MTKILDTAKCKDPVKWEMGFRTHADLFRTAYGVSTAISYGTGEDGYETGGAHQSGTVFEITP